jgi:uncharacterized protein YjgD (DUF1641 family)
MGASNFEDRVKRVLTPELSNILQLFQDTQHSDPADMKRAISELNRISKDIKTEIVILDREVRRRLPEAQNKEEKTTLKEVLNGINSIVDSSGNTFDKLLKLAPVVTDPKLLLALVSTYAIKRLFDTLQDGLVRKISYQSDVIEQFLPELRDDFDTIRTGLDGLSTMLATCCSNLSAKLQTVYDLIWDTLPTDEDLSKAVEEVGGHVDDSNAAQTQNINQNTDEWGQEIIDTISSKHCLPPMPPENAIGRLP